MKKKEYRCKYCGTTSVAKYASICANCSVKLRLVRKMQQMIRDTAERGKRNV